MTLSHVQFHKISKAIGPTFDVTNYKENKNNKKNCTNIKILKYFIKSRSNSINKGEKQKFEAKTVIDIIF